MRSLAVPVAVAGAVYLLAMLLMAILQVPLGTPFYFALTAVGVVAYVFVLPRVWNLPSDPTGGPLRRVFFTALIFAVLIRIPLAISPVNSDNDMIRYLWDGRIQRLGINPYLVLPADPEVAWTHTPLTRNMPSARHRSPYPPAAQLFFRLIVTIHESPRAMKLALVACDLLTILVVWRWLAAIGWNQWRTFAYAWNPLVVLEVSYSGHIDALGALWISAAALWLARRRTALATIAFVFAVATKLLPIVLLPLLWRRIRIRDAILGAALLALLYLPFSGGPQVPMAGVSRVVEHIRFNGPVFYGIRLLFNPVVAAATAVGLGMLAAAWCRRRLDQTHPGSWAWPMAIALACAPVIYPWYLLYLTPFLVSAGTLPLTTWTVSVMPVYYVWEISRNGGRWRVPPELIVIEFLLVAVAAGVLLSRRRQERRVLPVASPPTR